MGEVKLHNTMDAKIWTQEWLRIIAKNPSIPTDEGAMIGWFANAIMTGYDHAHQEMLSAEEDLTLTEKAHNAELRGKITQRQIL